MKNDYLWDRSGEPEPEIQKLEAKLVKFRHNAVPPVFPVTTQQADADSAPSSIFRRPRFMALAAAAAVVMIVALGTLKWRVKPTPEPSVWAVSRFSGRPSIGSHALGKNDKTTGLAVGQWLETDGKSSATIAANAIGEVNVEPNTRMRVLATPTSWQRLALERGTIHAFIWAPPGQFAVDTPSARAIDLGCAYTLHVDDAGAGLLRTTMGWVGFRLKDHESFIPAGAVCATRPRTGPGTPYFEDAAEPFRVALSAFDFAALTPDERRAQLDVILKQARKRDALTIWHLLARTSGADRERVYELLNSLVPPQGVTKQGVLRLDRAMLDSWWSQLGYGDISLWRTFERSWAETETRTK